MAIYWGLIGGGSASIPLFFIGLGLYALIDANYHWLVDFYCPPPPECLNCAEGLEAVIESAVTTCGPAPE